MISLASISTQQLEEYSSAFHASRANELAANAATGNGVIEASLSSEASRKLPHSFSVELEQGHITSQKNSGRCWIFAALNTFRYEVMHKWNLKDFEFSQSYIFFYDKLEKANYFLESVLKTLDEPVDGRLYSYINSMPINDGGQWAMFASIVKKYGVVPLEAFPESASSGNSRAFGSYITSKLREFAIELRKASREGASIEDLRAQKARQMETVYRMLVISLGEPPRSFDFTVHTKDGEVLQDFDITPQEFFSKYVPIELDDLVALVNAPAVSKPMYHTYTVKFLGNVVESEPVKYLNLPIEKMKAGVQAQLEDGHPVWFGSDCRPFSVRSGGLFDRGSSQIEKLYDIHYNFSKGDRLEYGDSAMNHAMVFQGVNLNQNKEPDRWRIENSWGKDAGVEGYYVCSDAWFDEFVYQAVINKKYLDAEDVALWEQTPDELEPWDPLGSLAD